MLKSDVGPEQEAIRVNKEGTLLCSLENPRILPESSAVIELRNGKV